MTAKAETVSAHTFQRNGFYERLAQMRADDPRTFAGISPASKLALFEYEKQLRQHEQEREFSK
jgi:hypothetical protein